MSNRIILPAIIIMLAFVPMVSAQYQFVQEHSSNGYKGMMGFTSTTTTYVTPTAKSEKTDMQFTGRFMKHFNQHSNKADITDLDLNVFRSIDYDKKRYTEMTFAELKKMWEQGVAQTAMPTSPEVDENSDEPDDSEYEWEKPVVKVHKKETGKNVNGFKCDRYILELIMVGKHKATGIRDTMTIVNDTWNTTVKSNAIQVMNDFNKKLFTKLGMEKPVAGIGQMLTAYKDQLGKLADEAKKLEGYPIKSKMRMTSTDHVAAAQGGGDKAEPEENSVDLGKNPLGGMLGGFARKMSKKQMQKKSENSGNAKELFQYTTELKSIKKMNVSDKLTVPAGFKKVASKVQY